MKKETLTQAIQYIDDDLVAQAAAAKKSHKSIWIKTISIAACFAILVCGGIGIWKLSPSQGNIVQPDSSFTQETNIAVAKATYPQGYSAHDYGAQQAVREANPVNEDFYKSVENFSYQTAAQILQNKDENMLYSPISLYYALSLATAGAKGATQQEMLQLLGVADSTSLATQCGNLYRVLYKDNEFSKLLIANSLWMQQGISFKQEYLQTAIDDYYSSLFCVDFSSEKSIKMIGDWITENTKGLLQYHANPNPQQIMSIINTIYFYDEWETGFEKDKTAKDVFTLSSGEQVSCDFMNGTAYFGGEYTIGKEYIRASLNLKSAAEMIFILPNTGTDIEALLSSPEKIQEIFTQGEQIDCGVNWKIPKFSYGSSLELNEALQALGIQSAFGNADFTGITDSPAFISGISQQTKISIDEKGVEAAAYTSIAMGGGEPAQYKDMVLDRPFIYGICTNNGTPLFLGVCNNPA